MKRLTWIIVIIVIVLAIISAVLIFNYFSNEKQSEKCFKEFETSFTKAGSRLLYPDFVRDCCAKPISEQASCLDQYGLLD
jgi:flagellar basal body-associated protein FliL